MYQPLIEVFSHPRQALQKALAFPSASFYSAPVSASSACRASPDGCWSKTARQSPAPSSDLLSAPFRSFGGMRDRKRRRPSAYFAMVAGFTLMLSLLLLFRQIDAVSLRPDFWGFLFCGVMGRQLHCSGLALPPCSCFSDCINPCSTESPACPRAFCCLWRSAPVCAFLILSRGVRAALQVVCRNLPMRRNCNHDFTGAQRERCKNRLNWVCLAARAVVSHAAGRACLKAFTAVTGTHLPSNKKLWGGAKQPLPTFFIPVSVLLHFFFPLLAVSIACR